MVISRFFCSEKIPFKNESSLFTEVVKQKYPCTPRLAYKKARMAANQAGLERRAFLNRSDDPSTPNVEAGSRSPEL